MTNPEIDWSNPAAIEAALAAEGLGVIGSEATADNAALIMHYAGDSATLAMREEVVRTTLARYQGDELGGAMAVHFTSPLTAELARSKVSAGEVVMDDSEVDAVDELVRVVRLRDLSGLTVEHVERGLGVQFELGGLLGIMEARERLEEMSDEDVTALRDEFVSGSITETVDDEDDVYDDVDEPLGPEDEDDEDDDLTDESGEEFFI